MTVPAKERIQADLVVGTAGGPVLVDQSNPVPISGSLTLGAGATVAISQTTPGTTNKVAVSARANSATPSATVVPNDQMDVWLGTSGQIIIGIGGAIATDGQDASCLLNAAGQNELLQIAPSLFNGTSWDRQRGNVETTLLASAARTTTTNSSDQVNYNGRRLLLVVNVSSIGTGSVTPSLQVKDSISGNYATVWTAAAALVANATSTYYFADGNSGGSFTESKPFGLPARTWRLVLTSNNANSVTASVSAVTGL